MANCLKFSREEWENVYYYMCVIRSSMTSKQFSLIVGIFNNYLDLLLVDNYLPAGDGVDARVRSRSSVNDGIPAIYDSFIRNAEMS